MRTGDGERIGVVLDLGSGMQKAALAAAFLEFGASYEVRTRDLDLGKVALYQLS